MTERLKKLEFDLNEIIDEELKKENIDFEIISEAVDGLLRLENTDRYAISESEKALRIKEITGKAHNKNKNFKMALKILIAAALIVIFLAVSVLAYVGIEYKITKFSDYSTVFANIIGNKEVDELTVGYIPEGFELCDEFFGKQSSIASFTNFMTNDYITVEKSVNNNIDINTEYLDIKITKIGDIEYVFYGEEKHGRGVVWFTDQFRYDIASSLSKEEILRIAVTVR